LTFLLALRLEGSVHSNPTRKSSAAHDVGALLAAPSSESFRLDDAALTTEFRTPVL
jgi:hypothetical protein